MWICYVSVWLLYFLGFCTYIDSRLCDVSVVYALFGQNSFPDLSCYYLYIHPWFSWMWAEVFYFYISDICEFCFTVCFLFIRSLSQSLTRELASSQLVKIDCRFNAMCEAQRFTLIYTITHIFNTSTNPFLCFSNSSSVLCGVDIFPRLQGVYVAAFICIYVSRTHTDVLTSDFGRIVFEIASACEE